MKEKLTNTLDAFNHKYENMIEALVPDDSIDIACTKTLICAASTHKRSCYARTVSIDWYVKHIKGATL